MCASFSLIQRVDSSIILIIIDHPQRQAAWSCLSVCMYMYVQYVCQTITFESLDIEVHYFTFSSLYVHSREYLYEGHQVKVKVTGAESKKISIHVM